MHTLTKTEIDEIKDGRAVLLDVRSDQEVEAESCKYAKHWDVQQITRGHFPDIKRDQKIFAYCRSGNRSALAQQLLQGGGYQHVYNIGGVQDVPEELCNP